MNAFANLCILLSLTEQRSSIPLLMIDHQRIVDSFRPVENKISYTLGLLLLIIAGLLGGCASGHERYNPIEDRILKLIEVLANSISERSQERAYAELEKIGFDAVPYLVAHLSDYRPLNLNKLSLANKDPNATEAIRHYSPATVHDALSAILNQITGVHFGFVYNGGTLQERDENRRKWIKWCRAKFPDNAATCGQ